VRWLRNDAPLLAAPETHTDPYYQAGSHPDVVARLWDEIGPALDADCRALIFGSPALVHPHGGIVLALCMGTTYGLRIPVENLEDACTAGCRRQQQWTGGGQTDIEARFGEGWVFGAFLDAETDWLRASFDRVGRTDVSR